MEQSFSASSLKSKADHLIRRALKLEPYHHPYARSPVQIKDDMLPKDMAGIDYLWFAEIQGYWKTQVFISCLHMNFYPATTKLVGMIFVPQGSLMITLSNQTYLGANPLRAVLLETTEDLVAQSLMNINLLEPLSELSPGNVPGVTFNIWVSAPNGEREVEYNSGQPTDEGWIRLNAALHSMIEQISACYRDPALDHFLKTQFVPISGE